MASRKRKLPTASDPPKSTPLPPLSKEVAEQFQLYLASHVELCPHSDFTFLDDEQAFRDICASIQVDIFNINEKFEDILQRRHSLDLNLLERARLALAAPPAPPSRNDSFFNVESLPPSVAEPTSLPLSDTSLLSFVRSDPILSPSSASSEPPTSVPPAAEPAAGGTEVAAAPSRVESTATTVREASFSGPPAVSPAYMALVTSSDVRFKLPRVLVKAFNTMGDREKFHRVLDRYFLPTVTNRHRPQPFKFNPIGPKQHMEMLGTSAIASYYDAFASSIPDLVYDLQDVHWKFLPDGSCALIMSFLIYGTKVFHTSVETYDSVVVRSDGEAVYSTTTTTSSSSGAASAAEPSDHDLIVEAIESLAADVDGDDDMILSPPTDGASSAATSVVSPPQPHPSTSSQTSASDPSLDSDSNVDADLDMDAIVTGIERIRLQGVLTEAKPILVIGTMTFLTRPDGKVYDMDCVFHNRLYPTIESS